jgi:hypothetical protein
MRLDGPEDARRNGLEVSVVQDNIGLLQRQTEPFIDLERWRIPIPIQGLGLLPVAQSRGVARRASFSSGRRVDVDEHDDFPNLLQFRSLQECPVTMSMSL